MDQDILKGALGLNESSVGEVVPTAQGAGEPAMGGEMSTDDMGEQRMGSGANSQMPAWYDDMMKAVDKLKEDLKGSIEPKKVLSNFMKELRTIQKMAAEGEKAKRGEMPEGKPDFAAMKGMPGGANSFMDQPNAGAY